MAVNQGRQGVEKTVLQNKKMESFGGPPVKEVGTWIIIGQRSHEIRRYKNLDRTKRRAERRASREEYNIVGNSMFVFFIVYNKLKLERHLCFRHSINQHAVPTGLVWPENTAAFLHKIDKYLT